MENYFIIAFIILVILIVIRFGLNKTIVIFTLLVPLLAYKRGKVNEKQKNDRLKKDQNDEYQRIDNRNDDNLVDKLRNGQF